MIQKRRKGIFVILSVIFVASLIISAAVMLPNKASAENQTPEASQEVSVWDGTSDTSWYNDTDTEFTLTTAAQLAGLEAVREGADCRGVDKVARDIIYGAGYEGCFGHGLGHGVGMYIHEAPRLSPGAREGEKLVTGQIVTVEPGIYIEGKYGCRIEDMVCVRQDGAHNFAHSPKELIELF